MKTLWLTLVLAACLAACSRGGGSPEQRQELAAAETRWHAQQLGAYQYDYEELGFSQQGAFHVTIRNGAATAVPANGNSTPNAHVTPKMIEGLFDEIRANFDDGRVITTVTYHPTLGYPMRAYFDSDEEGAGFSVTNLAAD